MIERLSLVQLDALREIGTIGAGRAATALADLIGTKVEIDVPQVRILPIENVSSILGDPERMFFVLDMELLGEIRGRIFLLFSPEHAKVLSASLLGKKSDEIRFDDEMVQSTLKESANILSGSFLTALVEMTNINIMSSVPLLAMDMIGAVLDFIFIQIAQYTQEVFFIKTDMKVTDVNLEGFFLLFPQDESLRKILSALGVRE
ncbi:MAG: chemotaxis protein CheC [Candidatus Omnitrophica bacterium]|jgi:chemotaxis protein CheC|nr:chemotaxis protein CheC [Candidatus Omnitrophota bacterium]MDD5655420.1 chemotaxis protein CheC [Candidatus Omnitrophota bacterium]